MELSIPRPRVRWLAAGAAQRMAAAEPSRQSWAAARGATRWAATADIAGAFPGCCQRGGALLGSKLRVTDRYLVVDEGRAHGFGLPLTAATRIAIGAAGETLTRRKSVLHLTYDDRGTERTIVIRPRTVRFGWPGDYVGDALTAFRQAGHEPARLSHALSFVIPWDQARHFREEPVIWSGRATAPLDPLGFRRAGCDLWLTTEALMWSSPVAPGLNRVPLDRVVDALPVDLSGHAAAAGLVIGYLDGQQTRRDLFVICDRHLDAERNAHERDGMAAGFQSLGIAPGEDAALVQPWRRDWGPTGSVPPRQPGDGDDPNLGESPPPPVPVRVPAPALTRARTLEADALSRLAEANDRARDRLPVARDPAPMASLEDALAEIETAEATGALTSASASARRARLLALIEAGWRLRVLVRLCQSGQIAPECLEERRLAILHPLNQFIVELEPVYEISSSIARAMSPITMSAA
ncbi:MAG: hypothetical protein M3464_15750 [Chloroflexota bacterium]|nr:hypothetical protein [Chloroflexota bacterium]